MTVIPSTFTSINVKSADLQNAQRQVQKAQAGSFDALFSMFGADKTDKADASSSASSGSVGQGSGSIGGIFSVLMSENSADSTSGAFGFSSDFTDAFGSNGGPLFDYISQLSSSLHLTAEQNQALQKISIEHKNDAGNAGVTQTIAKELADAGIVA